MSQTPLGFPSEKEISEVERHLEEMRQKREAAKQLLLQALRSGDVINSLSATEKMGLMKILQASFQGARKKTRGNPVPPQLKSDLEAALKKGGHTLAQLEKIFGLSISYISRIKKELGLTNPPVENAYGAHQLNMAAGG